MMVVMTEPAADQPDQRRVRIGLAIISLVVLVAAVMFFVVEEPAGKGLMLVIAGVAIARMVMLVRWVRRGGPSA
jgi:hypothetical protein